MVERLVKAVLVGIVVALIVWIVLAIISAILPGVVIDARFWAGILGLLAGILAFFNNERTFNL